MNTRQIQLLAGSKAFHSRIQKNDRLCSRADFFLFSQRNLTFKYYVDEEIDLEAIGSNKFKGFGVYTIRLLEEPKNDLKCQRTYQFIGQIGHNYQIEI